MEITIRLEYLSAERLWDHEKPFPKEMHLSTNLSLTEVKYEGERMVISYTASIHYSPSVAQVNLKGKVLVKGEREELNRILENYEKRRSEEHTSELQSRPHVLVEATILSRSLQLPPPLPLPLLSKPPEEKEDKPTYVG